MSMASVHFSKTLESWAARDGARLLKCNAQQLSAVFSWPDSGAYNNGETDSKTVRFAGAVHVRTIPHGPGCSMLSRYQKRLIDAAEVI